MAVFHSRLVIMILHDIFSFSYSNFNFSYIDFVISRSDFPISHSDFSISHIDHWDSIGDFQLNPLLSCLACHTFQLPHKISYWLRLLVSVLSKITPALQATHDQSFCTMDLVVLHLFREDPRLIVVLLVTVTTLAPSNIILYLYLC